MGINYEKDFGTKENKTLFHDTAAPLIFYDTLLKIPNYRMIVSTTKSATFNEPIRQLKLFTYNSLIIDLNDFISLFNFVASFSRTLTDRQKENYNTYIYWHQKINRIYFILFLILHYFIFHSCVNKKYKALKFLKLINNINKLHLNKWFLCNWPIQINLL